MSFRYTINHNTKLVTSHDTSCKEIRLVGHKGRELYVFYYKGKNVRISRLSPPKYIPASFKVIKPDWVEDLGDGIERISTEELFGEIQFDMADRNA